MNPPSDGWRARLLGMRRLCLDSNVVIYVLEGRPPYANLVEEAITRVAAGEMQAVVSAIVETEVLVKPLRERDRQALVRAELFFQETPHLLVRNADRTIARRAALVRADTGLSIEDALIAATAMEERCDAILGNDILFYRRFDLVPYILLGDYT